MIIVFSEKNINNDHNVFVIFHYFVGKTFLKNLLSGIVRVLEL